MGKMAPSPGTSPLPERSSKEPWKEKLTLVIPPRPVPKLDLPFEKVPALNEENHAPVLDTGKSSLQGTLKELDRMVEKLWDTTVPVSTKELLNIAPGLREAMIQKLTPKAQTMPKDPVP